MNKKALILGIGGQDGSFLAELLLKHGYEVHGVYRRTSTNNLSRIQHIIGRIHLHQGDLADGESIARIIRRVRPEEIYNEADQDHVGYSKETPQVSIDITAGSVQRLLETVLECDWKPRVFQPISATIYEGFRVDGYRIEEHYKISPNSPYACAKAAALYLCQYYRRKGVYVTTGIMFNHESERRGPDYLLQRIVQDAISISRGTITVMEYSNIDMPVDIGYAPEYMRCVYDLIQRTNKADDFIIGTGMFVSIRQLILSALSYVGFDGKSIGNSNQYSDEVIKIANPWKLWEAIGYVPETYGDALVRKLMEHKGVITSHG